MATKKTKNTGPSAKALIQGVLEKKPVHVARMISLAERGGDEAKDALRQLYSHTGHAHIIGLTGVPGSGKSTLVNALISRFRGEGLTVAVIAVDPSSPFSGGAILGDRVRMGEHTLDDGVFIRSLATRGALGGLAWACFDTLDILDAAGFDMVLIETVGVGQEAVDISNMAETVIVVSAPGLGDEIQAIKAGVLEIADIHVVSKCDTPDWERTASDLKAMQGIGLKGRGTVGWTAPVIPTSAETGKGITDLSEAIQTHKQHLMSSGEGQSRRRDRLQARLLKTLSQRFEAALGEMEAVDFQGLTDQLDSREITPGQAAEQLLKAVIKKLT